METMAIQSTYKNNLHPFKTHIEKALQTKQGANKKLLFLRVYKRKKIPQHSTAFHNSKK